MLHAVVGLAVVGALTHDFIWSLRYLKDRYGQATAERRFLRWGARLFAAAFLGGLLLYPQYKLEVRIGWLDAQRPWVGRLFDIKEHFAAVALASLAAQSWIACRAHPAQMKDPLGRLVYVSLAGLNAGLVWVIALIGLYTATHRSFGAGGGGG